jgi:hypothetical protein
MVAVLKVVLIAMLLVFLDLIIQQFTGGEYGIIAVLLLIIRFIIAMLALILHAITHIDQAPQDLLDMITGFISLIVWFLNSLMAILLDIISLPFRLIGGLLATLNPPLGLGMGFDLTFYAKDWFFLDDNVSFGGFRVDLTTMTIQVALGDFNPLKIWLLVRVDLFISNKFGFSFFGNTSRTYLDFLGNTWYFYDSNEGALAIFIKIKDGFIVYAPDVAEMGNEINRDCGSWNCVGLVILGECAGIIAYIVDPVCALAHMLEYIAGSRTMPTVEVKAILDPDSFSFSFESAFQDLLNAVPVPSLGDWVDGVYGRLLPQAVGSSIMVSINQFINHEYIYMRLEEFKLLCLKRKLMINTAWI